LGSVYGFLEERLRGAKKLAILGVGSTLRGDDAAGMRVVERLQAALGPKGCPEFLFCAGGTAPENFSGKIKHFNPDCILIIDAADMGAEAGSVMEIMPETVGGLTFCSHMLPLRVMIDYLTKDSCARVTLLGIQYKCLDFDCDMTPEIRESVDTLCGALERIIINLWHI